MTRQWHTYKETERFDQNRLFIKRLTPVVRIALWIIGLYFVIAGIIAPPIETVIAISASIGIAVGFASQDILRNIFGGIMIITECKKRGLIPDRSGESNLFAEAEREEEGNRSEPHTVANV